MLTADLEEKNDGFTHGRYGRFQWFLGLEILESGIFDDRQ